jgi:TRAP-type uncharacterized transport system fused permease subunit
VPFMFVGEPALLMIGDWPLIIGRFIAACIGLFAAGLHGNFIIAASLWQRALLIAAGLSLVKPDYTNDAIGAFLVAVVIAVQMIDRRRLSAPAATAG